MYYPCTKTKALISFAVTAKLICVFVFAYAKSQFSHGAAHMWQRIANEKARNNSKLTCSKNFNKQEGRESREGEGREKARCLTACFLSQNVHKWVLLALGVSIKIALLQNAKQ